jgi:hypothetical protein
MVPIFSKKDRQLIMIIMDKMRGSKKWLDRGKRPPVFFKLFSLYPERQEYALHHTSTTNSTPLPPPELHSSTHPLSIDSCLGLRSHIFATLPTHLWLSSCLQSPLFQPHAIITSVHRFDPPTNLDPSYQLFQISQVLQSYLKEPIYLLMHYCIGLSRPISPSIQSRTRHTIMCGVHL